MGKRSRITHTPMDHLRAWRESLGLSRQTVANRIATRRPDLSPPVDQATIAKWESGETAVRVEDLSLLAEVYGTTNDRLFFAPGDAETPELMRRLWEVANGKDREAVNRWLALGETLPDIQ